MARNQRNEKESEVILEVGDGTTTNNEINGRLKNGFYYRLFTVEILVSTIPNIAI